MKKILLFFVGVLLLQPIMAFDLFDSSADPFTTLVPGGKFAVVDSGKRCKIKFTEYTGTAAGGHSTLEAYIIRMDQNQHRYQVWSKKRDNITQFSANMSEGYNISQVDVDKDSFDIYYLRFNCSSMAVKMLNDDHMLDIELEDSI